MSDDPFDIAQPVSQTTLAVLHRQLEEATRLEIQVENMEEDLKAIKKQLNFVKTTQIPNTMTELQMSSVTWNGWKCSTAQFVSGSLPKEPEKLEKAIQWLDEHEGGNIIKTSVSVDFAKSGHNEAVDLAQRLEAEGFPVLSKSGVHPQTLQAWARERLRNGDALDTEVLGLFTGTIAKMEKLKK